jgi:hypothetical protein
MKVHIGVRGGSILPKFDFYTKVVWAMTMLQS